MAPAPLAELNQLDQDAFTQHLAHIFETSPWIAREAWQARPFDDLRALHRAMVEVVSGAPRERQLELIRAHPDLAGKAARTGNLTNDSQREQAGAGLNQLSEQEYRRFHELNSTYQEKFGFPFILAIKGHDKTSILASFETRLANDLEMELTKALTEIGKIAKFRLEALLSGESA